MLVKKDKFQINKFQINNQNYEDNKKLFNRLGYENLYSDCRKIFLDLLKFIIKKILTLTSLMGIAKVRG